MIFCTDWESISFEGGGVVKFLSGEAKYIVTECLVLWVSKTWYSVWVNLEHFFV